MKALEYVLTSIACLEVSFLFAWLYGELIAAGSGDKYEEYEG